MGRVNHRWKWNSLVSRYISESRRASAILYRSGCHKKGLRPRSCMHLYKAKVSPIVEYGTELWTASAEQMDQLRKVQLKFGHTIIGENNYTSNVFVALELGMMGVDSRKDELTLRWWWRLNKHIQLSAGRTISSVAHFKWQQVKRIHGDMDVDVVAPNADHGGGFEMGCEWDIHRSNSSSSNRNNDGAATAQADNDSDTATSMADSGLHSDMNKMRALLFRYGFEREWRQGIDTVAMTQADWKKRTRKAVRERELKERQLKVSKQPSLIDSGYGDCAQARDNKYAVAAYLDDVYNREAMQKRLELRWLITPVGYHGQTC